MALKIDRVQLEIVIQQDKARQRMIELESEMKTARSELNKIKKYTAGLLTVLCLSASSCDVLDVDPTGTYSDATAYSSMSNLDLYVKYFYGVLYANADINCGSSCLMDDGAIVVKNEKKIKKL